MILSSYLVLKVYRSFQLVLCVTVCLTVGMDQHETIVNAIATQIRTFYQEKKQYRIYHGSTNSTRHLAFQKSNIVDTSQLNHVSSIDVNARTALVEPNVPMDQLVDAVLPYGLIPTVVMEFPGITVGGGFAGTGAESGSFRHGYFDSVVNWAEFILPDGEITKISRSERPDLFTAVTGSMGTFGIATLFEVDLVPTGTCIEVTYHRANSTEAALGMLDAFAKDPSIDYLDGMVMSPTHSVVVTGKRTDSLAPALRIQQFSRASDPWYYRHAAKITRDPNSPPFTEAVPVRDYLFRYDRAAFWCGAYAYQYFMVPCNRITRWALDSFMKTRTMFHALHASGHSDVYIIQDLVVPTRNVAEFVEFVDEKLGLYPLWLCPIKPVGQESMHPRATPLNGDDRAMNIGVWGPGPTGKQDFVRVNRELERKVRELGGMKWLYAQTYYTEDEFWQIYDKKKYDAARVKFHASHLPSMYDKVKADVKSFQGEEDTWGGWLHETFWSIWPLSGLYGVAKTVVSKEYLLSR